MAALLGAMRLATLDTAELLDAAVELPGGVGVLDVLHALQLVHSQVTAGPVFNVVAWGVNSEDLDQAVALEMHEGAASAQRERAERAAARAVRVDQAVGLETGQPTSATGAHLLEIG